MHHVNLLIDCHDPFLIKQATSPLLKKMSHLNHYTRSVIVSCCVGYPHCTSHHLVIRPASCCLATMSVCCWEALASSAGTGGTNC